MSLAKENKHKKVTLQEKVRFLQQPENYPDRIGQVEARETNMSWVFLTDKFVYKLKKPVCYAFLDFSTLAARKHFCEEEIRLNRRLAGPLYVGTVKLAVDSEGSLNLADYGDAVDWLVKMKRLPTERMLDCAIKNHTVTEGDIQALVMLLAEFYTQAEPIKTEPAEYWARMRQRVDESQGELIQETYGMPADQVTRIHGQQLGLLARAPALFETRAAQGRIIEAHGDLRPEHICLGSKPVIIDCLEFNREFRILDPVDELAFLIMECERLGAHSIGRQIYKVYREATDDHPSDPLLCFYKSYRACLRAKIALWHTREPQSGNVRHWQDLARHYLDLAEGYEAYFR